MKRWSRGSFREVPELDSFLEDIASVCKRHGLWISHEDGHGAFEVVSEMTEDWIMCANDNRDSGDDQVVGEIKYTAIYVESCMIGSHRQSLTKIMRIIKQEGETVLDMLTRHCIEDNTVFLFVGHPKLQGE